MSTLIDIDIPFANGNVGSIADSTNGLGDSHGNGWCWFGGNNGRKIFSLRVQEDEDYWFVEVSESDNLQARPMTKTTLYTRAIPANIAGLYSENSNSIEMCRISSSAVYVKVFTNGVSAGEDSHHYVVEIDEDNGNEVSVTAVNDQMPDFLRGGAYSYSQNPYSQGYGIHHRFMSQLDENKFLTYEINSSATWGYGNLVERSWDPETKSLTNRVVCSNYTNPTFRSNLSYRTDAGYGHGDTWSFVPELDQRDFQVMRPTDSDPDHITSYSNWPVMHGDDSNYGGDNSHTTMRWMQVVTGRDGLLHFVAAQQSTGGISHNWSNLDANYQTYNEYAITYNPADGSWGLTGRYCHDGYLPDSTDKFGIWLPLNTMTTAEYAAEEEIDLSTFNGVANSRVFKTWMVTGGRCQHVQGISTGSPMRYYDEDYEAAWPESRTDSMTDPYQALQSIWLDYDHFITISSESTPSSTVEILYTIYRYYEENKIEVVSHNSLRSGVGSEHQTPKYIAFTGANIFQRPSANVLLSDKFGDVLVTLTAGQSGS